MAAGGVAVPISIPVSVIAIPIPAAVRRVVRPPEVGERARSARDAFREDLARESIHVARAVYDRLLRVGRSYPRPLRLDEPDYSTDERGGGRRARDEPVTAAQLRRQYVRARRCYGDLRRAPVRELREVVELVRGRDRDEVREIEGRREVWRRV